MGNFWAQHFFWGGERTSQLWDKHFQTWLTSEHVAKFAQVQLCDFSVNMQAIKKMQGLVKISHLVLAVCVPKYTIC